MLFELTSCALWMLGQLSLPASLAASAVHWQKMPSTEQKKAAAFHGNTGLLL